MVSVFLLISVCAPAFGQVVKANGEAVSIERAKDDFDDLKSFLPSVRAARIVHLKGSGSDAGENEALHRARRRFIQFLHEDAGYKMLVLPVGIFEGAWANAQLRADSAVTAASQTMYRVWRESDAFLDILRYCQQTGKTESALEIIGGLCRYHATGKELYSPHLIQFFDAAQPGLLDATDKGQIEKYLAGRSRLSRSSTEIRQKALILADTLLAKFASARPTLEKVHGSRQTEMEYQFLKNMSTFVELEQLRAGDIPEDPEFQNQEKQQNLTWQLETHSPQGKIIYWEGRGAGTNPLPAGNVDVFEIVLSYEKIDE